MTSNTAHVTLFNEPLEEAVIQGYLRLSRGMLQELLEHASAAEYAAAETFLDLTMQRYIAAASGSENSDLASDMVKSLYRGVFASCKGSEDAVGSPKTPAECFHKAALLILRRASMWDELAWLERLGNLDGTESGLIPSP